MKKTSLLLALTWLSLLLAACAPPEAPVLTRLEWERGHGSMWGNQMFVAVTPEGIDEVRYVDSDSQLQTVRDLPVTQQQWEELSELVQKLELKKEKPAWLEKLLKSSRLDGGEFHTLTLFWQTEKGTQQVRYQWPSSGDADALETLLETLAKTANLEE